jgi:hypothetical protein
VGDLLWVLLVISSFALGCFYGSLFEKMRAAGAFIRKRSLAAYDGKEPLTREEIESLVFLPPSPLRLLLEEVLDSPRRFEGVRIRGGNPVRYKTVDLSVDLLDRLESALAPPITTLTSTEENRD